LMNSKFMGPVNIGSEEMVTINELAQMVLEIAEKKVRLKHIQGPQGVRGRKSDNRLIREQLGWAPSKPLRDGLAVTYRWIENEVQKVAMC
jgi:GDP-D-mannose 3', 5'-epimerase